MYIIFTAVIVTLIVIVIILVTQNKSLKKEIDTPYESLFVFESEDTQKAVQFTYTEREKHKISLDLSMIPENIIIDESTFLPHTKNRKYGYGKKFNAFVSEQGTAYHRSQCRFIKGRNKKLVHRYIAVQKYTPCQFCTPNHYIDKWYIEFLKANFCQSATESEILTLIKKPNPIIKRYSLSGGEQITFDLE